MRPFIALLVYSIVLQQELVDCVSCTTLSDNLYYLTLADYLVNTFQQTLMPVVTETIHNVSRCSLFIEVDYSMDIVTIKYGFDNSSNFENFQEFQSTISYAHGYHSTNNFIYFCSSNDYCNRLYHETQGKWLAEANYDKLAKKLKEILVTGAKSGQCYANGTFETCYKHVCVAEIVSSTNITKCDVADDFILKLVVELRKTIEWVSLADGPNIGQLKTSQYIYCGCEFDECNGGPVLDAVLHEIEQEYNTSAMINSVIDSDQEVLLSTATNKAVYTSQSVSSMYSSIVHNSSNGAIRHCITKIERTIIVMIIISFCLVMRHLF